MKKVKRKKYRSWGELNGLDGLPEKVPGWTAGSVTEAMRVLAAKGVCTQADDEGSVTVWKVKDGVFACEFQRYLRKVNHSRFATVSGVRSWLRVWWPVMTDWNKRPHGATP